MKPILLTALIATVSPIALAQQSATDPTVPTIAKAEQAAMVGASVQAPLPRAIETAVMDDWIENELGSDVHASVIEGARRAYAQTMFEPIWTEDGAKALKSFSRNLFEYGLTRNDVLDANLQTLISKRFESEDDAERAEADLALSAAWLRMAAAISGGMTDEGEADSSEIDAATYSALPENLIEAGKGKVKSALESYEPDYPQYNKLIDALAQYREIRADGGWLAIPDGDVIEAGDTDARIPAIRQRLAAEGYDSERSLITLVASAIKAGSNPDAPAEPVAAASEVNVLDAESVEKEVNPEIYDEKLVNAVKEFQTRQGIEPDGVVGPSTLAAMNESVDSKIARIADSLDRWRHQGAVDKKYVWANIPSYTAEGWKNGRREIAMKTIVGMESRETPIFNDEIEYVVANPNWYAPVSIVKRDKLPKLQRDPGYAQRGNFKIYDRATGEEVSAYSVNWNDPSSAEKYRLVQQSGSNNALGELKIMFPNQYSVYLHGTPSVSLFDKAERAFSSGCVRLENPTEMAKWLAEGDAEANPEVLEDAVEDNLHERFEFASRIPVHITYMTVTVNDDGTVNFWRDIYDRTEGIKQVEKFAPLYEAEEPITTAQNNQG
ncbi:L,D-transpeptidase family protein [Henriciella sp. AS95]|uniref:L,D-transpeptidase family protein n=1 Tax=Henriciella sp. AS95 TaxID=3135782 RepID=UPI00317FAC8F